MRWSAPPPLYANLLFLQIWYSALVNLCALANLCANCYAYFCANLEACCSSHLCLWGDQVTPKNAPRHDIMSWFNELTYDMLDLYPNGKIAAKRFQQALALEHCHHVRLFPRLRAGAATEEIEDEASKWGGYFRLHVTKFRECAQHPHKLEVMAKEAFYLTSFMEACFFANAVQANLYLQICIVLSRASKFQALPNQSCLKPTVAKGLPWPRVDHGHGLAMAPHLGPHSIQSCPKVGPKSVQSCPKVGPKSVQTCPKVGPKSAQTCPKVGPKSGQTCPKVGPQVSSKLPQSWAPSRLDWIGLDWMLDGSKIYKVQCV